MSKISILGSGWLGVPLAKTLIISGHSVNISTTHNSKKEELTNNDLDCKIVNIEHLEQADKSFFDADLLVIAITSKNIKAFEDLVMRIENSHIKKVLYISTTSVYPFNNQTCTEDSETIDTPHRLIEKVFKKSDQFLLFLIKA